ncbi:patatin-like phospholipase family protein [Paucibacter sp. PLA-PC-4]|uniref:patatin-like phospholipase family protein n=1 Tax=Paucibacter sp. PLA-PC-4 TaxID=2993655 RepID=UPI002248D40D|nr:patatin-like phospholipase family protein [Paucibacter sp. PLA-PC-4]MCX2863052.1 patatin-like phospholipase family protein [Paucibacter sp. PLA-PC-4]
MRRPALTLALLLICASNTWAQDPTSASPSATAPRPKLGLVLSGGGARGLAHVGVLKVLERERIPVDLITGTSMGAIIGGLYASGMSAADLERELLPLAWDRVFASRVERQNLSQRRKEEDFEFSAVLELGMRDGEFRAPQGTLSSRGLEILLRRYTQPVRNIEQFDALPTPFRAISTDMESGSQVVSDQGDLALAMRSSMSVPGVFAPVETKGRILGDGGLVNNLPVDVARRQGAERLIAVNVGTPLAARETLSSLVGVTAQMINILTEQNVQRSIASLWAEDVLITPELGKLGSGDFDRARDLIQQGERAAEAMLTQLRPLAVSPEAYAQWRLARTPGGTPSARLSAIEFEGSERSHPERFAAQLASQPGQVFDAARAERDAQLLASSGDYERVDFHVAARAEGDALVFAMEDKSWGPNYFRIGLDLSTDFSGESAFNIRISHNRHWLTPQGTEWRNQLTLGQTPRLYSEIYHPLIAKLGTSNDWFVSGWGELERRSITLYDEDSGQGRARLGRRSATLGLDIGQPWGRLGELRLGLMQQNWRISPDLLTIDVPDGILNQTWRERGVRIKAVVDQLDFANFPQNGYRLLAELAGGRQSGPDVRRAHFQRLELQATGVKSWGAHTLNLHTRIFDAKQREDSTQGPYALGGFQQLSGYQPDQLVGQSLVFGRATYYMRLRETPLLTRGFFVGGSLEVGNAWASRHEASLRDLRKAMSVFVGADTGLGPLYLALGHAPRGSTAIYLFIGRP